MPIERAAALVPVVDTARLRLRAFHQQDLDAYAAMCADAEIMRYIGTGQVVGPEVAWRHMALFLGSWVLLGCGMWALEERATARLVGRVGYLHPPEWPACELGWLLARDFWGRGYAFEAATAAREHGRRHLGLDDLISLIRPDNRRSIQLAERLGCRLDGQIEFMGGETLRYRHPRPSA